MREAASEPRRPHRHGCVLAVEVGFGDGGVWQVGRVEVIEEFEQFIFVRYGEEHETVGSLLVPEPADGRVLEGELEGGVCCLRGGQPYRKVRSADDVEPVVRVEVALEVVHGRQLMTGPASRQSPNSPQKPCKAETTSRSASRAAGSPATDQLSSPVSATAAALDEPWERMTSGRARSTKRM